MTKIKTIENKPWSLKTVVTKFIYVCTYVCVFSEIGENLYVCMHVKGIIFEYI